MKLLDCSACIGLDPVNRRIVNHESYPVFERVRQAKDAAAMLKEMDFAGVDAAVVWHQASFDTGPEYGNRQIIQQTACMPERLKPVWFILPPLTEEAFLPEKLLPAMQRQGVAFLRAAPQQNRYFLNRVAMGDLLEAINDAGIPLYLSPYQQWEYIYAVLEQFPKLTVIITNYGLWGSDRYFYPLVKTYPNVYVDTSDFQELNGIQKFVNIFGAHRMLFGSNYPSNGIGGPLACLLGSGIGQSAIERIAHRNLEELEERAKAGLARML